MIFNRPLTPSESRTSLRRLALHNLANGLSFAGLGETVMTLVAVKLGCPDAVSATFGGTLFYAGFAAMPLGRLAAARWGAARAGGAFWALRNAFAMLVVGGVCSWENGTIARRIGVRMELVVSYALLLVAAAAWTLLPAVGAPAVLPVAWIAIFAALGIAKALNETATLHYAVSAVEPRLVVSASLFLYLSTGLLAGVAGMVLSAFLMGRAAAGGATATPGPAALEAYRGYFLAVLWLLLPLGAAVWRIPRLAPSHARATKPDPDSTGRRRSAGGEKQKSFRESRADPTGCGFSGMIG